MQDRLNELEKQQEENVMSMAETKKNMHEELELKEKQLIKAEEESKQFQAIGMSSAMFTSNIYYNILISLYICSKLEKSSYDKNIGRFKMIVLITDHNNFINNNRKEKCEHNIKESSKFCLHIMA